MKKTNLIKVTNPDNQFDFDLVCGSCEGVLYGYDEEICPSCGCFVDMDNEREVSSKDFF